MFAFSSKTQVDKKFRLPDLYKMMAAERDVKADAQNILSVTLKNVLSEDTLGIPAGDNVTEIYIFEIELSDKRIPPLFIACLDRAINLHTFFVLRCGAERLLYGCFKERTEKGVKLGKFYATDWQAESALVPLPLNVASIGDIYTAMLDELIPITAKTGENTGDFVARYDKIVRLKKEIVKKQKQVDAERQPKRRFALNDELTALKRELDLLTEGENENGNTKNDAVG